MHVWHGAAVSRAPVLGGTAMRGGARGCLRLLGALLCDTARSGGNLDSACAGGARVVRVGDSC